MKLLLDTHLLLWAAGPAAARDALQRDDFQVDARLLLTSDPLLGQYPGPVRLV